MIRTFNEMVLAAKQKRSKTIAVAVAEDAEVLSAVNAAVSIGIVDALLVGDKEEIAAAAAKCNVDISKYEIINIKDKKEACRAAVEMVSSGKAQILMKGLVDTSIILKAVLDEKIGLRTGNVLSHVAVFEIEGYDRLFYVTDVAMNIAPTLDGKKQIIENAALVANALDNKNPKVGVLAAVEKVNAKMQATIDAAELVRMNQEGIISDCIVGGPYALDNAVSQAAAKHKGMTDPLAGHIEILLVPNIESGNFLYKSIVFFAKAKTAGIIVGAKAPIVLTSRADSKETKLNSIVVGVLIADK